MNCPAGASQQLLLYTYWLIRAQIAAGEDREAGERGLGRLAGECVDRLLDAIDALLVGLLRDQRLDHAALEVGDLCRVGVVADDLDLACGVCGLEAGVDALGDEHVGGEHPGQVGVRGVHSGDCLRRLRRVIAHVLRGERLDARILLDLLKEALDTPLGGGHPGLLVHHDHGALAADQLGHLVRCLGPAFDVVRTRSTRPRWTDRSPSCRPESP